MMAALKHQTVLAHTAFSFEKKIENEDDNDTFAFSFKNYISFYFTFSVVLAKSWKNALYLNPISGSDMYENLIIRVF